MPETRSAIQEEPARGFYGDPGAFATQSGLDFLRGHFNGQTLPPPVHYLYGLTIAEAGPGTARFTMPAAPWLLPPQGVISGATLALLADGPLGCAVQTALPPATPYTTAEMSMTFLRPVLADNRLLTGEARLVHSGRSLAVSEARITDAPGRLVAASSPTSPAMPSTAPSAPSPRPARRSPPWMSRSSFCGRWRPTGGS